MKSVAVFVIACAVVALASGSIHTFKKPTKFVDDTFLVKQKAILDLLQHIYQKDIYTDFTTVTDKSDCNFFDKDFD